MRSEEAGEGPEAFLSRQFKELWREKRRIRPREDNAISLKLRERRI
jgi:hypothetical protein